MKKFLLKFVFLFFMCTLFAYNPPVGSLSLFNLSSPTQMTSASSVCGGGLFLVGPESIVFNPSLTSMEQRVQLDLGYTALISQKQQQYPFNSALQAGILIPSKWFIFSGYMNGTFCSPQEMNLGNSFNAKVGLAKEISEKLCIGINLHSGAFWGVNADWSLGCDLGAMYKIENLGFTKDFRIGASLLNLGKYYYTNLPGISEDSASDSFPYIATLKMGVASKLYENENFACGASFDMTIPAFQNIAFDTGIQLSVKDTVFVNTSYSIDVKEMIKGHVNLFPSVGVSVKFMFNSTKSEYLKNHDWDKSEMIVSSAWQNKYETIQAISGGVKLKLGLQDTLPPEIKLWDF